MRDAGEGAGHLAGGVPPGPAGVLAYAAPGAARPPSAVAFWTAVVCGALPILCGTVALLGYLATRSVGFVDLGLVTLAMGVFVVAAGAISLAAYLWTAWRPRRTLGWPILKRAAFVAALLAANFPVAVVCVRFGGAAVSKNELTVSNGSGAAIDSFVVVVDGKPHEIGPIAAGGRATLWIAPQQDGQVTYTMTAAGRTRGGVLIGYVTHGPVGSDHSFVVGRNAGELPPP